MFLKISRRALLPLLFVTLALDPGAARANLGLDYGIGSRTSALANAGVAYGYGAFAAYYNPAGLPFQGDKRLLLELGFVDLSPNFTSIDNVIVENTYTSDKVTYSNVDTGYRNTAGEELGVVYRLLPDMANLTLGLAAFLPFQQVTYLDSGETFVPEYVLYRSRTQRPQVNFGLGADLGHGLSFGANLYLAFTTTSAGTVFLQTDPTKPSTMRFSASLKPKFSPQFGMLYKGPTELPDDPPPYTLGLVVRLPASSDNSLFLQSGARAFGSFAALDFDFTAVSAMFYDPWTVEFGGTILERNFGRTYLQLDFQAWSKFEAPALLIQNPTNQSCGSGPCGVTLSPGQNPTFPYRNIFIPRVGQEVSFGRWTFRGGYAYRPSMFDYGDNDPQGAGNYLDPSKHIFTLGAGYHFDHFLKYELPCDLDFNFAYHALVTHHVQKAPGDENGNGSGDLKIGAPGYDAGGNILGGGVSLTLAF